jgi:HSP20 family molecular chaperone IbpA
MSLSRWKHFNHIFDDLWRHSSLLPYWTQHNPWRHDFGLGLLPGDFMTRELQDIERRARELERLQSELMPTTGKDGFEVSMDVKEFSPNEITVKAADDRSVIIEGKHEERKDPHGYIARHFTRRYTLPEGYDPNTIMSELTPDGILKVKAPKPKELESNARVVPILTKGSESCPPPEKKAIEDEKK